MCNQKALFAQCAEAVEDPESTDEELKALLQRMYPSAKGDEAVEHNAYKAHLIIEEDFVEDVKSGAWQESWRKLGFAVEERGEPETSVRR